MEGRRAHDHERRATPQEPPPGRVWDSMGSCAARKLQVVPCTVFIGHLGRHEGSHEVGIGHRGRAMTRGPVVPDAAARDTVPLRPTANLERAGRENDRDHGAIASTVAPRWSTWVTMSGDARIP